MSNKISTYVKDSYETKYQRNRKTHKVINIKGRKDSKY